jgi:hypothetical protein
MVPSPTPWSPAQPHGPQPRHMVHGLTIWSPARPHGPQPPTILSPARPHGLHTDHVFSSHATWSPVNQTVPSPTTWSPARPCGPQPKHMVPSPTTWRRAQRNLNETYPRNPPSRPITWFPVQSRPVWPCRGPGYPLLGTLCIAPRNAESLAFDCPSKHMVPSPRTRLKPSTKVTLNAARPNPPHFSLSHPTRPLDNPSSHGQESA